MKTGRPKGSKKQNTLGARIAIRLTDEQLQALAKLPEKTISQKIRGLIDRWLARKYVSESRSVARRTIMKSFWCGWEVPAQIPEEDMLERWPAGVKGWCTGSGAAYATYVGQVDAENEHGAEVAIRRCYGPSGHLIEMRWEPRVLSAEEIAARTQGGRFR